VGLKKKCRRLNIPVPPRSYWARKQAGQNPEKTALPKGFPLDITITIYRNPMHGNPMQRNLPRRTENRMQIKEIEKQLAESIQSKIPHPLIEQTRAILQACNPNKDAILESPHLVCLDLKVSPGSLDRALSITNSIIKALEKLGHKVSVSKTGTSTHVEGADIRFGITEELKRKYLEPQELALDGYYRFGHSLFSENRIPTGNLCLTIYPPSSTNSRKNWRDTETQRLEDCLTSFIKGLIAIAARQNKETAPNDEWHGGP